MEKGESSDLKRNGGKGRRRTQLRKIEKEDDRLISFSKRKLGIIKKATELSVMCGAETAFIMFSPVGNPHVFGHPNVNSVVNKFLGREAFPIIGDPQVVAASEARRMIRASQLTRYHNVLQTKLDEVPSIGEIWKEKAGIRCDTKNQGWWESKLEEMKNAGEVKEVGKNCADLQDMLVHHMEMMKLENQVPMANPPLDASFQTSVTVNHAVTASVVVQSTVSLIGDAGAGSSRAAGAGTSGGPSSSRMNDGGASGGGF